VPRSADFVSVEETIHYWVGAYQAVLTSRLEDEAKLSPDSIDAMFQRLTTNESGTAAPR
jgi:hypothetical protein